VDRTWLIIIIASASLAVSILGVVVNEWRGEEGWTAKLVVESFDVRDNANVPDSGRQAWLMLRNNGPDMAYDAQAWMTDTQGEDVTIRVGGFGETVRGSRVSLGIDLPVMEEDGTHTVWIGWRDVRGLQERDTGEMV
jgi:hypothetical protein